MAKRFFISYTGQDVEWANWFARVIEEAGHEPRLQSAHFLPGEDFVDAMLRESEDCDHIIAVATKAYFDSYYAMLEFKAGLVKTRRGGARPLIPVRVDDHEPPALFATLTAVNLCRPDGSTVDEAKARALIERAVNGTIDVGYRDARFPGTPAPIEDVQNLPTASLPEIFGRDVEMGKLRAAMEPGNTAALTAVRGMGGVGKTTLALSYASESRGQYDVIWWLNAEATGGSAGAALLVPEGVASGLADLAVRVGAAEEALPQDAQLTAARNWLRSAERVLLVFDNAETMAVVENALGQQCPGVACLVTTRAPVLPGEAKVIDVSVWSLRTAARFLAGPQRGWRALDRANRRLALEIARELEGLPIALTQARAYLAVKGSPLSEYWGLLQSHQKAMMEEAVPGQRSTWQTFAIAMERVEAGHPDARALLEIVAQLSPAPVPVCLFETEAAPEALQSPLTRNKAIAALRQHALIERFDRPDSMDPTITTDCLTLHRLVRAVARDSAAEARRVTAVGCLASAYPGPANAWKDPTDPKSWPLCRVLSAHVPALLEEGAVPTAADTSLDLVLNQDALFLQDARGELAGAAARYGVGVPLARRVYGARHKEVAIRLSNHATVLRQLGGAARLKEAEANLREAVSIKEDAFGPKAATLAVTLSNLANVLATIGGAEALAEGEDCLKRAIKIDTEHHGAESREVMIRLGNLAALLRWHRSHDALTRALSSENKALALAKALLPSGHPSFGTRYNNLGFTLWALGKRDAAAGHFKEALAILRAVLEPGHPDIAVTERALAHLRAGGASGYEPLD